MGGVAAAASMPCLSDQCRQGIFSPRKEETIVVDLSRIKVSAFEEEEADDAVVLALQQWQTGSHSWPAAEPAIWCEEQDDPEKAKEEPGTPCAMSGANVQVELTGVCAGSETSKAEALTGPRHQKAKRRRLLNGAVNRLLELVVCRQGGSPRQPLPRKTSTAARP
eukprot:gb/GFBE01067789.1/.p1 GENE.gb/GFBE01067789.1/~~gb/GFBE01067789.1/.p1  ORF type:complete len:165 (+),score=43.27 gb/GFBE01067789.1/:1-495(+)